MTTKNLTILLLLTTFIIHSYALDKPSIKTFDVVRDFGANNNGKKDATKAFANAWKAACASKVPSQIYVPYGTYKLKPISFSGDDCKSSSILFRIDGILVAGNNNHDYETWISFHRVDGLKIKGGVIDAKGRKVWNCKRFGNRHCPKGAKSLAFDNSKNIDVEGLTSKNSQRFHIDIKTCQNVNMVNMTIIASGNSPNTDGIHLDSSQGVTIRYSKIMTGDDCISIGPNNQNVWIQRIFCGPGHGISIGSLGRDSDSGDGPVTVRNITVKSTTFIGTQNGLRIKTFASPIQGNVKDVKFLGATMINVRNPIIIDQNYCPHGHCPNKAKGSGIQISDIRYKHIHGTSSNEEIVTFDCSPIKPCHGLTLQDINLSYKSKTPKCVFSNASWKVLLGSKLPSSCLRS